MKRRVLVLVVSVTLGLVFVSNGWAPISEHKAGGKKPHPVSEH